jgi:hypothetical protein
MDDSLSTLARRLLPFLRRSIGCRVISTATQVIATATVTGLSFNTEISDTGGCWAVGNPTRLVAPIAGYYIAGGGFFFADTLSTTAARLICGVRANGTVSLGRNETRTTSGAPSTLSVTSGRYWLDVGEYFEIIIYHEQGADRTLTAASTTNQHIRFAWLQLVD